VTQEATRISEREAEVLDALGEHLSNQQIASRLHVSVRTVETHVSSLLRKLGVADRRALAALAPAPDQLLWDVGAGCGSIAIEWMRSTRGCEAIAIEHDAARCTMIKLNMDRLGAPRLKVIEGEAPATLAGLPAPDAVFIGGGIDTPGMFETAWAALKSGGRMVANVVTLEGEMHLYDLQDRHGGELLRLDVSRLERVGKFRALKPKMPIVQWRVVKP